MACGPEILTRAIATRNRKIVRPYYTSIGRARLWLELLEGQFMNISLTEDESPSVDPVASGDDPEF